MRSQNEKIHGNKRKNISKIKMKLEDTKDQIDTRQKTENFQKLKNGTYWAGHSGLCL